MKKVKNLLFIFMFLLGISSCQDLLTPQPVDLLTDDLVLNEPKDVPNVEIGLYSALRNIVPSTVIAGDLTADMLVHNGTFSQYRELGLKQITSANASASTLWSSIYGTIYIANFILEKLPGITGVSTAERQRVTAVAHFIRGYSYFIGVNTFGGIPLVTTTSIDENRNIPRSSKEEILAFVLSDYNQALGKLPTKASTAAFACEYAVRAALARYYLYQKDWANAEKWSGQVIDSKQYSLDTLFSTIVTKDFPGESILEVGYTISDDPGTNSSIGLNNLFVSRREIIPSNQEVVSLASSESGDRFSSIKFNSANLNGNDNGWSVAKYGTADEDNNNVIVFRLGEMYLIRAEARAQLGKVSGTGSALEDINVLRKRAKGTLQSAVSQNQMILLVENERKYELAYEGHRWYDLVRTGRASVVMPAFNSNWKSTYELWPIPQREIQTNLALVGNQNPGY